jgi:hypothetical protein
VHALAGKFGGNGSANAPTRTRYKCDLLLKTEFHVRFPTLYGRYVEA